jgi:titin
VGFAAGGVRLQRNSIHDNGALGLDLFGWGGTGVTPNDALDADEEGGNHLQNFPLLAHATLAGGSVLVRGALESEPLQPFELEFFASPTRDPSGHGEGRVFLGARSLATDAQGRGAFLASVPARVPSGWFVTATATVLARGETSEFSSAVRLTAARGVR